MCVSLKRGLVIVSDHHDCRLHLYSLTKGSLVRTIGTRGTGKGQFSFVFGGLCMTPDGDGVLVAEQDNNRVQEVRLGETACPWVRFIGSGVVRMPRFVDCNHKAIVVTEQFYISILSWATGDLLAQTAGFGSGRLSFPRGVRLLPHNELVVVDCFSNRLCVFRLNGEFVQAIGSLGQGVSYPSDMMPWNAHDFIVANDSQIPGMAMVSTAGEVMRMAATPTIGPCALAALPDRGVVIRDCDGKRIRVFHGLALRTPWITLCALTTCAF